MDRVEAADFHDIAQVADPRVAPDGDRVAFVRTVPDGDEEYAATIHVVPTGGGRPRQFTVAEGVDSQPRFSPSGDRLAFVSTRGADDDRPQLWVMPTDGGEARQVTDVAGGVGTIEWSPDGERIAVTQSITAEDREEGRDLAVPEDYEPETPDPRVIDRTVYRSMQRYFDLQRSQVYVVDPADATPDHPSEDDAGDDVRAITEDFEHDHTAPAWGDASTLYYAKSVGEDPDDSDEYDVVAHDLDAGASEPVHRTSGWAVGLAATEDDRIAHLYAPEDRASIEQTELKVYDRTADEVTHPTADLDRTLGYEAAPQWGPDEDRLYFTTPDEGAVTLWRATWDGGDPDRVLREDGSSIAGAHVGEDLIAFVESEWDHPGDVFVASRGGGKRQRLTRINDAYLDGRAVRKPEAVRFESEGDEVQGWVLTPPDLDESGDDTYPLAVEVHGGPHAMWTTSGDMWHEFQTLAAQGYVVFWCNPRGSTGYGEEYMGAIERDWGDVTMADVMAGVERVADRAYVDEDSVFLTGGSFGGYMTAWMVGHTDRFEAAVAQRGVYDLTGFYGSTDMAYKLVEGDFDATPWEAPEFLHEHSPTGHAHEVETPTLVLHSDDDYRTPACTAELFYRILRKHGVDTRMVRYPREGHELSRSGEPGHVVDRIERIVRWFDGYSDHDDADRALDRPDDDGLTAGEDADAESEDDG